MITIKPNLIITKTDLMGNILSVDKVHNIVVSTGLDLMVYHLVSSMSAYAQVPYKFMLGGGTTAAASTDTALQSSDYDISFTGTTMRSAGVSFEGAIYSTDGHGTTSNEIGLFTSSSQIIARALISPLIKSSDLPSNEYISWAFDFTEST